MASRKAPKKAREAAIPVQVAVPQNHAIGIILSGTDSTLGRAIVGVGGISLEQEPATAKYDGMPGSAIEAGYATHVVPAEKMPEVLLSGTRIQTLRQLTPPAPAKQSGMNRILMELCSAIGHDFSLYKKITIGRRIERRMSQHGIDDLEIYARYLKEHPAEINVLFKELLINVTSFFRDPEAFAALKKDILPQLFADKPEDYVFRVGAARAGEERIAFRFRPAVAGRRVRHGAPQDGGRSFAGCCRDIRMQ